MDDIEKTLQDKTEKMLQDRINEILQGDVNVINIMINDKITKILIKEDLTPEEEFVKEAYIRGLLVDYLGTSPY